MPLLSRCCIERKVIRKLELEKVLLVESGMLGFGIQNSVQVIGNRMNDWNPESKFDRLGIQKSSAWSPDPASKL